ncbi:agmatine deiminase family protein [Alkalicaulis satelles]|uniref:Agmatine deiminase family protein n=1 Tax=Alkalicaulis satelles TaxID=2609175 RepID=A0A5M6ZLP6_9PROT|nr:agmatine deiminase family protein [Alkalicaulis satelles]KAA5805250.1 agmatine deiminase family protein [Alkalicaulis satelles]
MTALRVPHEFEPQRAIHTLWPAAEDLWEDDLEPARAEFARFLTLAAAPGADGAAPDIIIYAATPDAAADVRARMPSARIIEAAYGDVWARDTGPVFVTGPGGLQAVRMTFNGWGGKYDLPGDASIGADIARTAGAREVTSRLVCEGGALEFDGAGSVITTRQCVLNSNRNPGWTEAQVEAELARLFGVTNVIWIDEGLAGDHTDGHVDNIARFLRPGVVACQAPTGGDDPNTDVLDAIARQLDSARDAGGRPLKVVRIPSPGFVEHIEGGPAAASHMNWIAGPRQLVVPVYNEHGAAAVRALQAACPERAIAASASNAILTGGGSFHCVTCNEPWLRETVS